MPVLVPKWIRLADWPEMGQFRDISDQILIPVNWARWAKMYWSEIWKWSHFVSNLSHLFQSDPLFAQTWHPWVVSSSVARQKRWNLWIYVNEQKSFQILVDETRQLWTISTSYLNIYIILLLKYLNNNNFTVDMNLN